MVRIRTVVKRDGEGSRHLSPASALFELGRQSSKTTACREDARKSTLGGRRKISLAASSPRFYLSTRSLALAEAVGGRGRCLPRGCPFTLTLAASPTGPRTERRLHGPGPAGRSGNQGARRHIESTGDSKQVPEGAIAFTALTTSYVGPVETRPLGRSFERHAGRQPRLPNPPSELDKIGVLGLRSRLPGARHGVPARRRRVPRGSTPGRVPNRDSGSRRRPGSAPTYRH